MLWLNPNKKEKENVAISDSHTYPYTFTSNVIILLIDGWKIEMKMRNMAEINWKWNRNTSDHDELLSKENEEISNKGN